VRYPDPFAYVRFFTVRDRYWSPRFPCLNSIFGLKLGTLNRLAVAHQLDGESLHRSAPPEGILYMYDKQYWDAVKGDLLPDGVDYVVFDGGVNSGPGRSIMWLQQALRPVYTRRIDGVMGMGTITALKAINNNDALIDRICDARVNPFATAGRSRLLAVDRQRQIEISPPQPIRT
jgi:hypothetical protein